MGEYAGELPRKFISFHCLENESNVPKDHNTEGTENYLDTPQRSEVEIVVIEETETSPTKSLAVLQVTGGKKTMSEERGNVDKECLMAGSQECLLSSSDEGSEGLEKFLRDKLESLGGDGIENIAEVDPAGVLELLDSNLADRDNTGSGVVTVDDEFPRGQVDSILRSELQEKTIGGRSKRSLCDVDSSASLSEPVFVSERLPEQRRRPAQRPLIDISKTHHRGVAELLAGKLRSKRKTSNTASS